MKNKGKKYGIITISVIICILILSLIIAAYQKEAERENVLQSSEEEDNISQSGESTQSSEPVQSSEQDKNSLIECTQKAMVYMENNGAGGNGSIYKITEEEVIIVTTYHLLQNGELIKVRFRDNFYAEGRILGVNEEHDVGFVTVPTEEISDETLGQIGSIQKDAESYKKLKQGDFVKYYFLSYDGVFVCQESRAGTIGDMNWYVADFDDYLIYNYCQVQPGMSGCAAVAEDGSYIGMVIGGYDNESAALSIQVIDKVYEELTDFTKS